MISVSFKCDSNHLYKGGRVRWHHRLSCGSGFYLYVVYRGCLLGRRLKNQL